MILTYQHLVQYMENFKNSFPEYTKNNELHDFGHNNWTEGTWVFHELYKLAKGISTDPKKKISQSDYLKIKQDIESNDKHCEFAEHIEG